MNNQKSYQKKEKISVNERTILGQSLRTRRRLLDLTQECVASRLGITTTAYSKIERGECGVTIERMNQIVSILGINLPEQVKDIPDGNAIIRDIYIELLSMRKKMDEISTMFAADEPAKYKK